MVNFPDMLPNESWLDYFRRKKQFSDLILLAWSEIEFDIDQLVVREFGLKTTDKKADILLKMNFQKKLEFLKDNKVITEKEFCKIQDFQIYRNKLFHGKQPFFFILSKNEKDKIMDNVVEVAKLVFDILVG